MPKYDAILLVSFGGPEGPEQVLPFLENVLRGRNVPRERMLEVAEHYQHFGGVSPINEQNRQLIAAVKPLLEAEGPDLPIYWGNRNWHPLLPDTLAQMRDDGVTRALAFVTSAFSCYSGCRQYRENIFKAREAVGPGAPEIDKIRVFHNHPRFIATIADRLAAALAEFPVEERGSVNVVYTAHSIPDGMAAGCDYVKQLQESCRLVSETAGHSKWQLAYQSRSGPPTQPWLEPDICDLIRELKDAGETKLVVVPIGFISDHMEVLFDLDTEARQVCDELGLTMVRAGTAGTHPEFLRMIRELILERHADAPVAVAGSLPANPPVCREGCCAMGRPGYQSCVP